MSNSETGRERYRPRAQYPPIINIPDILDINVPKVELLANSETGKGSGDRPSCAHNRLQTLTFLTFLRLKTKAEIIDQQ